MPDGSRGLLCTIGAAEGCGCPVNVTEESHCLLSSSHQQLERALAESGPLVFAGGLSQITFG